MDISLFSITLILFLIMDPLGNISAFLSLVKEIEPQKVRWIVLREMVIALILMIVFNFLGEHIMEILNLTVTTVQLSSALILFLTAIKILFPATNSLRANLPSGEPFLVPLAIPLIAGPSLLATIMLFAALEPKVSVMLEAIIIAWAAAMCILFLARSLQKSLGNMGLMACERLMGMILVMLSIQRFMEGLHQFVSDHAAK